jgi:CheY-like chemotaxis protein
MVCESAADVHPTFGVITKIDNLTSVTAAQRNSAVQPIVLLIEDETAVRNLVVRFLSTKGYQVLPAADGDEALALWNLHKSQIDLVLADIVMACGKSSRAMVNQFRTEHPALKVLFTSGYNIEETSSESQSIHFLPKPYRPDQLLSAVREAIGSHDL